MRGIEEATLKRRNIFLLVIICSVTNKDSKLTPVAVAQQRNLVTLGINAELLTFLSFKLGLTADFKSKATDNNVRLLSQLY